MRLFNYTVSSIVYEIPCCAAEPDVRDVKCVLVSLHGFSSSKDSMVNQALRKELTKYQTAVISFDLPAHGESQTEDAQLTVENCRTALLAVAAEARTRYPQAEHMVFMGTSFGGYILLQCLEELPDADIILRAPALNMADIILKIAHAPEKFLEEGCYFGYARPMWLTRAFYEDLCAHDVRIVKTERKMTMICGMRDELIPYELSKHFARMHAGVKLYTMEGCRHRLETEQERNYVVTVVKSICTGEYSG